MDEPRPKSIRISHPGWWLVWGGVLCIALLSLRIGLPYWRINAFLAEVKQLGGTVKTRPAGPDWLREIVGREAMRGFDVVFAIDLDGTSVDDAWLKKLGQFPELEDISLMKTSVGDAGIVHLDAGLAHLQRLTRLRELWLYETAVTEEGLKKIAILPELEHVEISMHQITDEGMYDLQRQDPKLKIVVTTAENDGSGFSRRPRIQTQGPSR